MESNYSQLQEIDDLQGELNVAENCFNRYQIQEYLVGMEGNVENSWQTPPV